MSRYKGAFESNVNRGAGQLETSTKAQSRDALNAAAERRAWAISKREFLVVALFTLTALISLDVTRSGSGSPLFWPATGLAAALLVRGRGLRRGRVLLGLLLTGTLINWLAGGNELAASVALAAVDVFEVGFTAYVLRSDLARLPFPNITFGAGVRMFFLVGIALPGVAALLGGLVLHLAVGADLIAAAGNWYTAIAAGALLLAPPIYLFNGAVWRRLSSRENRTLNLALAAGCLVLTYCSIRYSRFPLITLGIPLLVVAFRVGAFGAALMCEGVGLLIVAFWVLGVRTPGLADPVTAGGGALAGLPFFALAAVMISPIMMGFSADDRDRAERDLAEERERLQTTLRAIGDAVITTNAVGQITYLNAAAEELIGQVLGQVAGRRLDEVVALTNPQTLKVTTSMVALCVARGEPVQRAERCLLHRPDGSPCYILDTASPVSSPDGALNGVVVVLRDATAGVERDRELSHRAAHDSLTGLINRFEFERRLAECYERYRHLERPATVLLIDLDRFKEVNDTGGHAAGDEVLRHVATTLASLVRDSDLVSRLGGDEFGILLPYSDPWRIELLGAKILRAICELTIQWSGATHGVGASIGVAPLVPGIGSVTDWIGAADRACYEAKRAGRGQMRIAA